ncbi:MAG: hypothetical protein ACK4WH_14800 [Phycisphaerales bacterium]
MDQSLPGTAKASYSQTAAYFDNACEIKAFVKEFAQSIGIDTAATITVEGEKIDVYDWTCLNYSAFEALVAQTEQQLSVEVPDLKLVVPSWVAAMGPEDLARKALAKILAILGVTEFYEAFLAVLQEGWGNILKDLGEAITRRDWKRVRALLKKLLDIIISSEFFERLARRIGRAAAAKVVGKILAKFIPVVGWIWLIGAIIWAFAEEFI